MRGYLRRIAERGLSTTCSVALSVFLMGNAAAYDILDIAGPLYPVPSSPGTAPGAAGPALAPYVSAPPPAPTLAPAPWSLPTLPIRLRLEGGAGYNNGGTDTTVSSPGVG